MKKLAAVMGMIVVASLCGCSDSVLKESPEVLAEKLTTDAELWGLPQDATIDCGKKKIVMEKDKVITCSLTAPSDPQKYEVVVTITDADLVTYEYAYKVVKVEDN
ncbi:MAG: hypothetical protein FWG15_03965 [Propionibacteriaceae bacterium]|nr:hypothetical protein [Propionibacteriaceae bacterium]